MRTKGIEGIGKSFAARLGKAGIRSVQTLLEKAASASRRKEVALQTGISEPTLLEWVKEADLFRISGIEGEQACLLKEAGVDTVPELAAQAPVLLYAKMRNINTTRNLVPSLPSGRQVKDWIEQAKRLPKLVTE
jgi:predicted flap endonuclease-1-like 5' DNA nuclease